MLRFLSALLGPIFAKEMVEMSRRKRYYFNRVLYGLVLHPAFYLWLGRLLTPPPPAPLATPVTPVATDVGTEAP